MTRPASSRPTPTAARRSRPALDAGGSATAVAAASAGGPSGEASFIVVARSDLEQLGFLVLEHVVDLVDMLLRHRLELLLGARALVLADVAVLDELLERRLGVAAHVAHRDLGVLGLGVGHL